MCIAWIHNSVAKSYRIAATNSTSIAQILLYVQTLAYLSLIRMTCKSIKDDNKTLELVHFLLT